MLIRNNNAPKEQTIIPVTSIVAPQMYGTVVKSTMDGLTRYISHEDR